MQQTSKGYILPMVLIVILLGLAGFFLFAQPTKAPVVTDEAVPVAQQEPVIVPEEGDAVGEDSESGDTSTTTASTTLELEADL